MFGSNDDKKTPAAAGEKKGLFGWLRKKPQETVVEQPQVQAEPIPAPIVEAEPVAQAPAPVVLPMAEPVLQPVAEVVPEPEPEHKPWPELPVAEEPVALVDDVQAEHVTPPIPVVIEPAPVVFEAPAPVAVSEPTPVAVVAPVVEPGPVEPEPAAAVETSKTGFFARLKQGLSKTSASIGEGMASLFLGRKTIDDELLEDIETRLLTADVGVEATAVIIQSLTQKVARKQLTDADALYKSLQAELAAMLKPVEAPLVITPKKPFVILVVGVNGAGKTTTIGKLAKKLQLEGKKVMLAAGDTFRAAAVEQLQVWGERNKIPVIAQHTGADSASVIFDAVQAEIGRAHV